MKLFSKIYFKLSFIKFNSSENLREKGINNSIKLFILFALLINKRELKRESSELINIKFNIFISFFLGE